MANFTPGKLNLTTPIEFVKGVGPKKAELLFAAFEIKTVADILLQYPYRYVDRTKFSSIAEATDTNVFYQIKGRVRNVKLEGFKGPKRLTAVFDDGSSSIFLVWFRGIKWLSEFLKPDVDFVLFGKPSLYGKQLNFVHPELELASEFKAKKIGFLPMYLTSEAMKTRHLDSKGIAKIIRYILSEILPGEFTESLSQQVLDRYRIISRYDATRLIHLPRSLEDVRQAQRRIKFEELFFLQLGIVKLKLFKEKQPGFVFKEIGKHTKYFYDNKLSFELTGAQKRVVKEIREDSLSGFQMNRLLQGDVGSGKTIVALFAMLMAIDNGYQAGLMAPTSILAMQHFQGLSEMLDDMDVGVALLTGNTKTKERKEIYESLESGSLNIVIGTHALLEDKVKFKNLGMVIIDEQHRFGVAQRAKLWKKNVINPHVLIMTATPIPRTLAMTLHGDLSVSIIDELPPGRKPVRTMHQYEKNRLKVYGFVKEQIAEGRQVYVVYPLIEESEKLDLNNLMEGYESICRYFPLPDYKVSVVHGKMKADDKELEMTRFVNNETQIMVATTVIEVGVNVPNASIMIIENSERFGLSQLHQLRGRVGRGADQSYCILMSKYELSSDARKRLKTMVESNDGFYISEADLEIRGPGELIGTRQSGSMSALRLTNLAKDRPILEEARKTAIEILTDDPELTKPENFNIKNHYRKHYQKLLKWGSIS